MSWLPCNDPVLGDARSCDALELVIVPRARDLGGFEVRRALPHGKRQMVGPFIFFDHFGPVQFIAGQGMDVRPHPHIGLATVSYLFDGRIRHRDSLGTEMVIEPGDVNLMTAGRGIVHSERTPEELRGSPLSISGLQTWIALGFLLVCLINTVGLLLTKFLRRSMEIGVRRALGASKRAIFVQLLVESGIVGVVGGLAGLGLAWLGLFAVRQQPVSYAELAHLDLRMLVGTFGLAVVSSFFAGLLPAWRGCQVTPAIQLKSH